MAIGAIIDNATVLHVDGAHGLVMALPDHERGYVNVRSDDGRRSRRNPAVLTACVVHPARVPST